MKRLIILGTILLALVPSPIFANQNSNSSGAKKGIVNNNNRGPHVKARKHHKKSPPAKRS